MATHMSTRGMAAGLVAAVVAVAAGIVWLHVPEPVDEPRALVAIPTTPSARGVGVGPVGERTGVPVGWRRDEAGARAAGVAYVGLGGRLAEAGMLERRDMILALATDRYGPELAGRANREFNELTARMGEAQVPTAGLVWVEHPLTVRSEAIGADRVRVSVWSVLVFAAVDRSVPRQLWRTFTLELLWEDADWRVDGWSSALGPAPSAPPEAAIASGAAVREVESWTPAGGGR